MKTIEIQTEIETFCPLFSGYYNSFFEPDNEENEIQDINYQRKEQGKEPINYNDAIFDYKQYFEECSKEIVNFCEDKTNEVLTTGLIFKYEELVSPREYNFTNDSINILIQPSEEDINKMQNYINANFEEFKTYITNKYTSYSGFNSFYTNDAKEFLNLNIYEDSHILGTLLDFILKNECEEIDLYYYTSERVNLFCQNYSELIERN
ncbi:MAG: hypothetical protein WCJ62_10545 [Flavobacterium sp.]